MNTPQSELAVLLHADIVGSTHLVQIDERLAHKRIQDAFVNASKIIKYYSGTTREIRGDALVAEFRRVSDAVSAALSIQEGSIKALREVSDEVRPELRIGIAMGEVVLRDRTVTGEGIVLAQRIEQLANSGEVCVQGAVRDALPGRMPFAYEDLGEKELKGFARAVRAYKVSLPAGSALPDTSSNFRQGSDNKRPRAGQIAAIVAVLAVLGAAGWFVAHRQAPTQELEVTDVAASDAASTIDSRPTIAVLAFRNMSGDASQDYFAEGVAEDIITDLARIEGLFVVARNSSFAYKVDAMTPDEIAKTLGVRYLLDGSLRRDTETIRITVNLLDTVDGRQVWGERFDNGSSGEVFAFQDNVTEQVIGALQVRLTPEEKQAIAYSGTSNEEAYDQFLTGIRSLHNTRTIGGAGNNEKALVAFESSLSHDPRYARAMAGLGWTHWNEITFIYGNTRSDNGSRFAWYYDKAAELAQASIDIADNALARRLLSKRFLDPERPPWGGHEIDFENALVQLRMAVSLEPGGADAHADLAFALVFAGEVDEASKHATRARRMNPIYPLWYNKPLGVIAFLKEDYASAVGYLQNVHDDDWRDFNGLWLASALAYLGKTAEAEKVAKAVIGSGERGSTQFALRRSIPLKDEEHMTQLMEGLGMAGIPKLPEPTN